MFISTVVPSTMLNSTQHLNAQPYNFSVPYNFARGRNLVVNINPARLEIGTQYAGSGHLVNNSSRTRVNIPDDVTEYTITMHIRNYYQRLTVNHEIIYTISILFDTARGIITFTPISLGGNPRFDTDIDVTAPVLITICTEL